MIDFNNAAFLKLKPVDGGTYNAILGSMLLPGEKILSAYQTIRDGVVFTDKRIISINIQGITGSKKDVTSLPYSKIQAFSVETAGMIDMDSELDLWFSGLGNIRFEFKSNCNVSEICKMISEKVL